MSKIVQVFNIQNSLSLFSSEKIIQYLKKDFYKTDLGKIYLAVPWDKIIRGLKIRHPRKGTQPIFSCQGELALMILKSYTGLSDKKLAEQINKNIDYKIFCGLPLDNLCLLIKDYKIISRIRVKLAKLINWEKFQQILMLDWSDYLRNKDQILIDATCYETDMRYPTDAKLLWESLEYINAKLKKITKESKIKYPRSKYKEIKRTYKIYALKKKKSYKETRKILRRLLYINHKLYSHLEILQNAQGKESREKQKTIKAVLNQQQRKYEGEKIISPILSLHKPYINPIVRGKETKRVEFGAKVNKVQIDGINLIEKLSYKNFNESSNYESSIKQVESLLQTQVTLTGADAIYATNKNRQYSSSRGIRTDFKRKGRAGKNEKERKLLSSIIRKERGSRLEGSFGVEKRIYGLEKIKCMTKETEILMIYLGIHTKNMLEIGRRKYASIKSSPPIKGAVA